MELIDQEEISMRTMSVGDWVLTLFLTSIPVVGLILLFVWAFGDNQKIDRANYSKATLIWLAIGFVFAFIFLIFFGGVALLSQLD